VGSTITLDLTAYVDGALSGDRKLSLAIAMTGGSGRATFYSKERGYSEPQRTLVARHARELATCELQTLLLGSGRLA